MRQLMIVTAAAAVLIAGGARADSQPVACGGVQTGAGTSSCQIDATAADQMLATQLEFTTISPPGTVVKTRVDLVDSKGKVRYTTGDVESEGITAGAGVDDGLPPGLYTCRVVSSSGSTAVLFGCGVA